MLCNIKQRNKGKVQNKKKKYELSIPIYLTLLLLRSPGQHFSTRFCDVKHITI